MAFLFSAFLFISPAFSTTLPSGYTELEYIESSGTQYIDTDFVYDNNTRVVWDIQLTATIPLVEQNNSGVGYAHDNNYARFGFVWHDNNWNQKLYFYKARTASDNNTMLPTIDNDNSRHTFELDSTTNKVYVDGTEYKFDPAVGDIDNSDNLTLPLLAWLGYNTSTNQYEYSHFAKAKLYGCKIWDNGTLARNMIPAKRNSDNVVGLCDTVNDKFYTNSGTGSFTAGPEVLPCGYTRLEYIQADVKNAGSDGVPHINTHYYPASNKTRILMDTMFTTISGASNYNTKPISAGTYGNDLFQVAFGGYFQIYNYSGTPSPGDYKGPSGVYSFDTRYLLDYNKNVFSVDGTVVKTFAPTSITVASSPLIFMQHPNSGVNSSMRMYSCKIYEDDTLIRDFVPVMNPSGIIGLYDTVNGVFYSNSGTGTFVAGPTIASSNNCQTINITWGGLAEPDASGMCVYGETFTAPSTAPTAPSGLKFLGWIPR